MKYTIFDTNGFNDYKSWLHEDKSKYEKKNNLIASIQKAGHLNGLGKLELIKGDFS